MENNPITPVFALHKMNYLINFMTPLALHLYFLPFQVIFVFLTITPFAPK